MSTPQPRPAPAPRRVDIHCHCLPGLDDGPRTMDEAVALCRALVSDGFTDVIATPHMLGRFDGVNGGPHVRGITRQLQAALNEQRVPLRVHPGGEVRVDERIPRLLREDQILTLADAGKYLLIELSSSSYIEPDGLLRHLSGAMPGVRIILAHAERYGPLQRDPAAAERWLAGGAVLQVNADGLLGAVGRAAVEAALDWIARGWVSFIATDAHGARSRRPRMTEAMELIGKRAGRDVAERICVEQPNRVLNSSLSPSEGSGPR
jgi:protein-tyrosine phosphatase